MKFADATFDRRTLLRSLRLAPGLVPLLDAGTAKGAGKAKRLIVIAVPNGVREKAYWPTGTENAWVINPDGPLAPLLPHQKDVTFLGGIKIQCGHDALKNGLGGHGSLPFTLTGTRGVPGPTISDGVKISAGGPSVDVFIGKALAKRDNLRLETLPMTPFRHADNNNDGYLSFSGPPIGGTIPNVPTQRHDPISLFNDVFGSGAGDAALAKLRGQRKSILDFHAGYISSMRMRLGTDDRAKLDAHAEGIRRIEVLLSPPAKACVGPALPTAKIDTTVTNANPNIPTVIRAQLDILAAAMACDLVRVSSLLWQDSGNVRWCGAGLAVSSRSKATISRTAARTWACAMITKSHTAMEKPSTNLWRTDVAVGTSSNLRISLNASKPRPTLQADRCLIQRRFCS